MLRDALQELKELGPRGTAFRIGWELKTRSGLAHWFSSAPRMFTLPAPGSWLPRLPFADAPSVADAMRERIPASSLEALERTARAAIAGDILCFGRWVASYGNPIDWHLNPTNGQRWNPQAPWTQALNDEARVGDVKLTWEIARFPQAYQLARAATFVPASAEPFRQALLRQFRSFMEANPYGLGVHWGSGQEIAIRMLAWAFALSTQLSRGSESEESANTVAQALIEGATHVEEYIAYAREAVYNNHLLGEALALYATGVLLPQHEHSERWRINGRKELERAAEHQFYTDGAYIQLSHNYHRAAMQFLLWATLFARSAGDAPAPAWTRALERSLDFLYAHQNPLDGRLPNYGANDGALHSVFSTCDFSDFRPMLQAVSAMVRGERLYDAGPWDETTAWMCGPAALDLPLRSKPRKSVAFQATGFHVLRGSEEGTFSTFRCGTVRDRFSQIDMLHLDVWWKGHNVLCDPGSYLYNGPQDWHHYFYRTQSHNTLTVDGHDQMLHYRRFKNLYWTQARQLAFDESPASAHVAGEHEGFQRNADCTHRRSVLFVEPDVWLVADRVSGENSHRVRLHWLGGPFPHQASPQAPQLSLTTPVGAFSVGLFDGEARPLPATVVAGGEAPIRGWLSRYYGEKVPVPSLAAEVNEQAPMQFLSVLSAGSVQRLTREPSTPLSATATFALSTETRRIEFALQDGLLELLSSRENS